MVLTITPAQTSVTVEWGQVTGATLYEVKYSTTADGSASFSTSFVNEPTRTHSKAGLLASHTYWAKVTPYDVDNNPMTDAASAWVAFTTTA